MLPSSKLSFKVQLLIIVLILLLVPAAAMFYDIFFASKTDDVLVLEIERKLTSITNVVREEIYQDLALVKFSSDQDTLIALKKSFNKIAVPLSHSYPGVRICLYIRDTDKIIIHGYLHEFGTRLPEEKKEREKRIYNEALTGISAVTTSGTPITRLGKTWDDRFLERLVPIKVNSEIIAVVWAEERMHPIFAQTSRMRLVLRYIILSVFIFGVAASMVTILTMMNHVRKIKDGLIKMEKSLDNKLPDMPGEMGQISSAINDMAQGLIEKEKLIEQYRRSENLMAMGRLVTNIAHELRAPVSIIQATAQVMETEIQDVPNLNEYVRKIEKQVERHNKLINELLDFGRPGPSVVEPVNLSKLIDSVINFSEPLLTKTNIKLEFIPAQKDPLIIQGDKEKLKQVFINLILNAIEAMAAKGTLTIKLSVNNGQACVMVRDTGKGIPKEDLSKIFEPFYTKRAGGSGLGLAISKRIIQIHGGRIQVESESGRGATFTVCLPLNVS